jgi:Rieske 2Fe-2S family protein
MQSLTAAELMHLKQALAQKRPGHGLPRDLYHDGLVYRAEMDFIWRLGWLFAGHSCQIPQPGDYFLLCRTAILIIVRDNAGQVRALYNVCRHRGTTICEAPQGKVKRFVCPYHQWTYDLDGRLLLWRGMQDGLDKSQLGLHAAHAREVEGLIFISMAKEPPDFGPAQETFAQAARPQGLGRARVAKLMDFNVGANWKLVWENNRECYHCNVNHPQYTKANFDHYNADDTIERIATQLATVTARSEAKWAEQGLAVTRHETGMTEFPDPENNIWWSANRTPGGRFRHQSLDGKQVALYDYTGVADVGTPRMRMLPNFEPCQLRSQRGRTAIPRGLYNTQIK